MVRKYIDRLVTFTSLTGKLLMDSFEQPVFAIQLENFERKNIDGLLAKHQIRQYFSHHILQLFR